MAEMAFCGSCGGQILATAKFCNHCGADQAQFATVEQAAPDPVPEPEPSSPVVEPDPIPPAHTPEAAPEPQAETPGVAAGMRETAERYAPGSEALAGQLLAYLRTPGVALAGISALVGFGVCLGVGLILAIALPNASFLAVAGGAGVFKETMAQAVSFLQVNLQLTSLHTAARTVPVLFVLIPILGVAAGMVGTGHRTAAMSVRERVAWAAAAGVPFAFLMMIVALSVGEVRFDLYDTRMEFSAGSVFLLALVWGAVGGLVGMAYVLRGEGSGLSAALPARPAAVLGVVWAALRPLLLGLLVVGAIGTVVWLVQVVREDGYREFPDRSTGVAVVEQAAYAGDHAINILPLGAGADQRLAGWPAIPIAIDQILDLPSEPAVDSASDYDIFDFNDTMPAYLFVPMLLLLIAIPGLLALYAGFAVVRRLGEGRVERALAWGALVGPIWSITMVFLATLARKNIVGNPIGDSVFVAFLLGGAVLGALGGLLAAQGVPAVPQPGPGDDSPVAS